MEIFKVESSNKSTDYRTDDSVKKCNSKISIGLISDRLRTLSLLARLCFPVPLHQAVYFLADLEVAIKKLGGYPVAIKPLDASNQQDTLNINNLAEAQAAYELALRVSESGEVLVEKYYFSNKKYRILIISGRFIRAIEITSLQTNDCSRSWLEGTMLEYQNYSNDDLKSKHTGNSASKIDKRGKIIRDFTNQIHVQNISLTQKVAKIVGLDTVEIEIVSEDLSLPLNSINGVIINVNSFFRLNSYFL